MPSVSFSLKSNAGYLEISERRQTRLAETNLDDEQAVRHAITDMGFFDTIHDELFQGGSKQKALDALATIVLARHAASTAANEDRSEIIPRCTDAPLAQQVFLDQLSPEGLRRVLVNCRKCPDGYFFQPNTTDAAVKNLLSFALPSVTAGLYLERAGMFDRAALAFNRAAEAEVNAELLHDAALHFKKVAKLWTRVDGADFRAHEARFNQAQVFHRIADREQNIECNDKKAAKAYQSEAKAWRKRSDFLMEGNAWRKAENQWRIVAVAAKMAGDKEVEARCLDKIKSAQEASGIAFSNGDKVLEIQGRMMRQRRKLGYV